MNCLNLTKIGARLKITSSYDEARKRGGKGSPKTDLK